MIRKVAHKVLNFFKQRHITLGARALVIEDDRILLVRHTYINGWYSIGGGVEKNESTLDAAKRELREEVGIIVNDTPPLLGIYHNTREKRDDYVAVYICKNFNKVATSSSEIAEEKWFALDQLPNDISPATKRRIEEYLGLRPLSDKW